MAVRKRPIFPRETRKREFDAVTVDADHVTVHDARLKPDLRNLYMVHRQFRFDSMFGENATNDEVYEQSAQPLVRSALRPGGAGTVLMFGQTVSFRS